MIIRLSLNINDDINIDENIDEYYSNKKRSLLIVFDDIIANMISSRNFSEWLLNYLLEAEK